MKPAIWYHTADKQPDRSGDYLAYRGWGIAGKADCDSDWGLVWYDKSIDEWRDYSSGGHYAFVYYWTEARPDIWTDNDVPVTKRKTKKQPNPALEIAWKNVQDALRQYEIVKALT
jgi:hypothetical protein